MRGFTLIELILAIVIFGMIASLSAPALVALYQENNLHGSTQTVVQALHQAQSLSEAGYFDDVWGVRVQNQQVIVFKGSSFSSRNSSFDKTSNLFGGLVVSGLQEVVFDAVTGNTVNTGSIVLTTSTQSQTIIVNQKGMVSY